MALVGRTTNTLKSVQTVSERQSQSPLPLHSIPNILVVIDSQVDDYPTLVNGLTRNATPLVLQANGEGLRQINQAIATAAIQDHPITHLHIICHGAPGQLTLGKQVITARALDRYRSLLQAWGVVEICLYACEVATSPAQRTACGTSLSFLQRLHQLTGASIVASAHKVGNAMLGGVWELEHRIGELAVDLRSEIAIAPDTQRTYAGVLNTLPTISTINDQVVSEDATPADNSAPVLNFTVSDVETNANDLTITTTSDNLTLLPNENIVVSGIGNNRSIAFLPATNQFGSAVVTVIVSDGISTTEERFTVTVTEENDQPTISVVADQTIAEDGRTDALSFTVGDVETAEADLTISALSNNQAIVANDGIVINGTGAERTVTVTPVAGASGDATITLQVNDGTATTTETFTVQVNEVNDTPTVSAIANQETTEDVTLEGVTFTIGDEETPASTLAITATSSNQGLIADDAITITPNGANQTLSLLPSANQSGTAIITVNVSDGENTTQETFVVTVTEDNDAPTIAAIANQASDEDTPSQPIAIALGDLETPSGDLAVTVTSSDQSIVDNSAIEVFGSGANRSLIVTPTQDAVGTTSLTVTVSDGSQSSSQTFDFTVNPVNDAPTSTSIADQVLNEDSDTGAITFTVSDIDSEVSSITVSGSSSNPDLIPTDNIVVDGTGADRTVTVTPAPNANGTATITLTISDNNQSTTETFNVSVLSDNDLPTISTIATQTIQEDSSTEALNFSVGDLETNPENLTVTAASSNSTLIPKDNIQIEGQGANRTISITPAPDEFGSATISVTVNDGLDQVSQTFEITVTPDNDAPTISPINDQSTGEDETIATIPFNVGDAESPSLALQVTAVSDNPTLLPTANIEIGGIGDTRHLSLTPEPDQSGTATITVSVNDGDKITEESFTITVDDRNDAPVISTVSDRIILEDSSDNVFTFTVNDAETASDNLTISVTSSNPDLIDNLVPTGNGDNQSLTIAPRPHQNGTADITIAVDDGELTTTETFTVTVAADNDAPTLNTFTNQTLAEDGVTDAIAVTIDDVDDAVHTLILEATSSDPTLIPNENIQLSGIGGDRTLIITPAANQFGSAVITVTVRDGVNTTTETFEVNVTANDDAPVLSTINNQQIQEDGGTLTVPFLVNDVDTPRSVLDITATSNNTDLLPEGAISLSSSANQGTLSLTPAANMTGNAIITLQVADGVNTVQQTFEFVVSPENDQPTISSIADQTIEEDGRITDLAFTVGDIETAADSLIISTSSSNPNLLPANAITLGGAGSDRTLTLTPMSNTAGSSIITVTVNDGTDIVTETFNVSVGAENDAPTLSLIGDQIIGEDSRSDAIVFTVGDVETPTETLVVTATSSDQDLIPNGSITLGGNGSNRTITVTPSANQFGTATITVGVNDGNLLTENTFEVTVSPDNDLPTLQAISHQSTQEDTPIEGLAIAIGDIETAAENLLVTATSSNPNLIANNNITIVGTGSDRSLSIIPTAELSGSSTIAVTVDDGQASVTELFDVIVEAVNDQPTITAVADQLIAEDDSIASLAFTVGDVETDPASLLVTATSDNPTLIPSDQIVLSGSGSNRTLSLSPTNDTNGTATITLVVDDGGKTTTETFEVIVAAENDTPTLSAIEPQTTGEDQTTDPIVVTVADLDHTPGSLTVTATAADTSLVPNENITIAGTGGERAIAITPAEDASGSTTITVTVSDGLQSSSQTFELTVDPVNDAPTISTLSNQAIAEDGFSNAIPFTVDDIDSDIDELQITASSSDLDLITPNGITISGTGNERTLVLTPEADQSGSATITLAVTDGDQITESSFTVSVGADNDAPIVSVIDPQRTLEDTESTAIEFVVADSDNPVGALLVTATSADTTLIPSENISISGITANRSLTVTPAPNQFGQTEITVYVSDGTNISTQIFEITIEPDNDAPVLRAIDNQQTAEDTPIDTIAIQVSDVESPAGALTITPTSSNPQLIPADNIVIEGTGSDRTLSITPTTQQNGTSTITLILSDGNATTAQSFEVVVNAVNDAPTLQVPDRQTTSEDTPLLNIPLVVNDQETSANNLTVSVTSSNPDLFPAANIVLGGQGQNRTINVTPIANAFGEATLTVTVDDGIETTTDLFTVEVMPTNDLPTVGTIPNQFVDEDGVIEAIAILLDDLDLDPNDLTLEVESSDSVLLPQEGLVLGGTGQARTLDITPATDQAGTATITVTTSDGTDDVSTSFDVTVVPVNDAPQFDAPSDQTINEDNSAVISIANLIDTETPVGALIVEATSSNAELVTTQGLKVTGSGDSRMLTITPEADQVGTATISVSVSDSQSTTVKTFELMVDPTNDAPTTANPMADQVAIAGANFEVTVDEQTFQDVDANDVLSYTASLEDTSVLPGWISFNPTTQTFSGQPTDSDVGTIRVTVTATDQDSEATTDTFELNVIANNAPTLAEPLGNSSATATIDFTRTLPTNTFEDVDPSDRLILTASQSNGTALPSWLTFESDTQTFSGTPTESDIGQLSITVAATDRAGLSATEEFVITVEDAPVTVISPSPSPAPTTTPTTTPATTPTTPTTPATTPTTTTTPTIAPTPTPTPPTTTTSVPNLSPSNTPTENSLNPKSDNSTSDSSLLMGSASGDRLKGSAASDTINGQGGNDNLKGLDGNDRLLGGQGNDKLIGGNGGDTLLGGGGNDTLKGGKGNDVLKGGGGQDKLVGGKGEDLMIGGGGADLFILSKKGGPDTIRKFKDGSDLLKGVKFGQLTLTQDGKNTILSQGKNEIAILTNINVDVITSADFA